MLRGAGRLDGPSAGRSHHKEVKRPIRAEVDAPARGLFAQRDSWCRIVGILPRLHLKSLVLDLVPSDTLFPCRCSAVGSDRGVRSRFPRVWRRAVVFQDSLNSFSRKLDSGSKCSTSDCQCLCRPGKPQEEQSKIIVQSPLAGGCRELPLREGNRRLGYQGRRLPSSTERWARSR